MKRTLFGKPKSKKIAGLISIKSPKEFARSITALKKKGLTLYEKRSLVLAQNIARVQLKRKYLSAKERREMKAISRMKLPKITR